MPEEDLVDIDSPLSEGDEYSPDDYWAELQYCEFDAYYSQLKNDMYNFYHYGHEDGPVAYAAECYAEELLEQEIAEGLARNEAWERHLNPIQAFEAHHEMLEREYGIIEDKAVYEWLDLQAEDRVDDEAPVPSEDQCQY